MILAAPAAIPVDVEVVVPVTCEAAVAESWDEALVEASSAAARETSPRASIRKLAVDMVGAWRERVENECGGRKCPAEELLLKNDRGGHQPGRHGMGECRIAGMSVD